MDKVRQPSLYNYMANLKPNPHKVYQIIEKIGEGSYATVYKAFNKITDRLVAIKVFPAHHDQFAYLNEIDFLRKVDHPYMVKLHDVYTTSDEIWMILDYCQLGSIQDLMLTTGKSLTEPEIACVCYSVLHALDYIHAQNKIHRDLKSANILMNSFGQVKLTDFGICSKEASANSFIGSLLWMAPEMISCTTYDASVDIWALGICVIEMAEGNAPFHHLHMVRAKYAIQKKPQTNFSDPLRFSEDIRDFLQSCLQLQPENRPKASELLQHPFIEKYKGDLAAIRKILCDERIKKLEEFRINQLIQKHKGEGPQILHEITEEDEEKSKTGTRKEQHVSNLNNQINISQDNQTFIEKPSIEINAEEKEKQLFYSQKNEAQDEKCESQIECALRKIREVEWNNTDNASNFNSPNKRRYGDQLMPEIVIFSSPLKPTSHTSSAQTTQEHVKEDFRNLQQELHSFCQSKNEDYEKQNEYDDPFEISQSIAGETLSEKTELHIIPRIKMYKATNESNFRVKHKGASRTTTRNVDLSESIVSESILIPVSVDREKVEEFEKMQENNNADFIKRVMLEFRDLNKRSESSNQKRNVASTSTQSKEHSSGGSLVYKTPNHTPNISGKQQGVGSVGGVYNKKENVESFGEEMEVEKAKLEKEMRREMEEIQRKYMQKLNYLEKMNKT